MHADRKYGAARLGHGHLRDEVLDAALERQGALRLRQHVELREPRLEGAEDGPVRDDEEDLGRLSFWVVGV